MLNVYKSFSFIEKQIWKKEDFYNVIKNANHRSFQLFFKSVILNATHFRIKVITNLMKLSL